MRIKIARALLSVYDKTGIVDLARALHEMGVELVSSGGTSTSSGGTAGSGGATAAGGGSEVGASGTPARGLLLDEPSCSKPPAPALNDSM